MCVVEGGGGVWRGVGSESGGELGVSGVVGGLHSFYTQGSLYSPLLSLETRCD